MIIFIGHEALFNASTQITKIRQLVSNRLIMYYLGTPTEFVKIKLSANSLH